MPAYVIGQVKVTDPKQFAEYQSLAPASIAQYGGRYLARGGTTEPLEGHWDAGRVVVLEFPDAAAAKSWYNSPEYQRAIKAREGAAELVLTVVEGL